MFFIPLPIVLLEVIIFTSFVHFYGFWDVFLAYFLPSILGVVLFSIVGQSILRSMQTGLSQGQMPSDKVLHRGALMIGSIFLIIPMFLTRVVAVFLIVPLLRHLSIFIFKTFIFKRLGKFNFIRMGGMGPGAAGGGFSTGGFKTYDMRDFQQQPRQERDVEAVDVTPIEITHTKIDDKKDEN